jgi:hypothetical protein
MMIKSSPHVYCEMIILCLKHFYDRVRIRNPINMITSIIPIQGCAKGGGSIGAITLRRLSFVKVRGHPYLHLICYLCPVAPKKKCCPGALKYLTRLCTYTLGIIFARTNVRVRTTKRSTRNWIGFNLFERDWNTVQTNVTRANNPGPTS